MKPLRILSLLPAATEIVYLLGLEKYLVGVSHECDYPRKARLKPKITSSPVSNNLSSREINDQVAKLKHKGSGVFHIDAKLMADLRPNLILTQELCDVCAISWTQVRKAAKILESGSKKKESGLKIISLEPESVQDIFENIKLIGGLCGTEYIAEKIIKNLKNRLKILNSKILNLNSPKPRVLMVEWLDPIMVAGHWVPEMVEKAFGSNLITTKGQKSFPITSDQVVKTDPDIIIFAPCGFNIPRILKEKYLINDLVKTLRHYLTDRSNNVSLQLYLMDGNAYLTRPGPRIIDGVEILAEILHPKIFTKIHTDIDWKEFELK